MQVVILLTLLRAGDTRLCREMDDLIFSADFGQRRIKPMFVVAVGPGEATALPCHVHGHSCLQYLRAAVADDAQVPLSRLPCC